MVSLGGWVFLMSEVPLYSLRTQGDRGADPHTGAVVGLCYQFYHYRLYQLGPDNSC